MVGYGILKLEKELTMQQANYTHEGLWIYHALKEAIEELKARPGNQHGPYEFKWDATQT